MTPGAPPARWTNRVTHVFRFEEGGWRLTTIDGDTAVFQLGTEIRRLTVPAR